MGYENEIRAKAEMHGIKFDIYDWYRNQTWLQEIATTYDASSHGGDKYEKVKKYYKEKRDMNERMEERGEKKKKDDKHDMKEKKDKHEKTN